MAGRLTDPDDWASMRGDTDLEKRINSYLTKRFIGDFQIPDDECLDEAREIIAMVQYGRTP